MRWLTLAAAGAAILSFEGGHTDGYQEASGPEFLNRPLICGCDVDHGRRQKLDPHQTGVSEGRTVLTR